MYRGSPRNLRFLVTINSYIERMLTVVTTLKQQQRNVLDYLTAAMRAHLHGQAPPSLLPGS